VVNHVQTRVDSKRGCGWRKPGGLYLVSEGLAAPCGRLPIPLTVCPTCDHGFKPSRGWTWLDSVPNLKHHPCRPPAGESCNIHCPLSIPFGRVGLLWVGEVYYATPDDFIREADRLGVSRRIPTLPTGFIVGRTWVWLAHRKTIVEGCGPCFGHAGDKKCAECKGSGVVESAGVFRAFKPQAVEYVVTGEETEEELQRLAKRDITPVKVIRDQSKQGSIFEPSDN
jgi:hypothetical protein